MGRKMIRLGLMVLLSLGSSTPLLAGDSTISGRVVSPKEFGPIPVSVLILKCSDPDCQVQEPERFFHLRPDGVFKVSDLEPGSYMVLAYRRGLTPWLTEAFRLEASQAVDLEITMVAAADDPLIAYPEATAHDLERFDGVLAKMGEPPLCGGQEGSTGESYRFLWLRSFHNPILIGVRIEGGTASAVYKELDGRESDEPSSLIASENIDVNALLHQTTDDAEWVRRVVQHLAEESEDLFWKRPFHIESWVVRVDGATWTVEGRRAGKCHVVTRWSPGPKAPLRQFVESLISLTGKRFYYDEYY